MIRHAVHGQPKSQLDYSLEYLDDALTHLNDDGADYSLEYALTHLHDDGADYSLEYLDAGLSHLYDDGMDHLDDNLLGRDWPRALDLFYYPRAINLFYYPGALDLFAARAVSAGVCVCVCVCVCVSNVYLTTCLLPVSQCWCVCV